MAKLDEGIGDADSLDEFDDGAGLDDDVLTCPRCGAEFRIEVEGDGDGEPDDGEDGDELDEGDAELDEGTGDAASLGHPADKGLLAVAPHTAAKLHQLVKRQMKQTGQCYADALKSIQRSTHGRALAERYGSGRDIL